MTRVLRLRATAGSIIAGLLLGSVTAIVGGVVSPASATVGCDTSQNDSSFTSITTSGAWVSGKVESGTVRVQADRPNTTDITHQGNTPNGPEDMIGYGAGPGASDSATIQYFTPGGTSSTCYMSFRMRIRSSAGAGGNIASYQYRIAVGNGSQGLLAWFTLNGGGNGGDSTVEIWNSTYTSGHTVATIPKTSIGSDTGFAWAPDTLSDGSNWVYWKVPMSSVYTKVPAVLANPVGIAAGTATSNSTSFNKDCMDGFPANGKAGSSSTIDACVPSIAMFSVIPAVDLSHPSDKLNLVINTVNSRGVTGSYADAYADTKTVGSAIDTVTVSPNLSVDTWTVTYSVSSDSATVSFDSATGTSAYWRARGNAGSVPHSAELYTITAYRGTDSATVTYSLTVIDNTPPVLRLAGGVTSLVETQTVGHVITGANPYSISGAEPDTYTVTCSPALPTGVTSSDASGTVSGLPTVITSGSTCTIVGYKGADSSTVTYTLVVIPAQMTLDPANDANGTANWEETRTVGYALDTVTISTNITAPETFTFDPAPAGVTFDTTTGQIYGIPTVIKSRTAYKVTSTGQYGETATGNFYLTVLPPTGYVKKSSDSSNLGSDYEETRSVGTAITTVKPQTTIVTPVSYAFSDTSTPGLTYDTATGQISGTPTTVQSRKTTTITVTGQYGETVTVTYTLTVTPLQYLLTTNVSGGGSVTPGGNYESGTVVTLTASPASGYYFTGWSGSCSGTANPTTVTMTSAKTCTANFAAVPPVTHHLTVTIVGSGSVAPADGDYVQGSNVSPVATPAPGFRFVGWSGACSGLTCSVTMTGPKAVTATFVAIYPLTTTPKGNGNITRDDPGPDGQYPAGTKVKLTAKPDPGWYFTGWTGDCTGTDNPITVTVDAAKNCTANFVKGNSLDTPVEGDGEVTRDLPPTDGVYKPGTEVTITAKPAPGSVFVGWTGDCTGTTNPLKVTLDKSKSCKAVFAKNVPLETKVTGNGSIKTDIPTNSPLPVNQKVTLTAVPGPMEIFVGWSGSCSGTENPITVTMDAAKSCTANFVKLEPVPAGTYQPISGTKSRIVWEEADNAKSYIITVEGKEVCDTEELTCTVPQLLGPKSKVYAIAVNGNLRATPTRLTYQQRGPVRIFVVNFPESEYYLTAKAKRILDGVAKKMAALGFKTVRVKAYTDGQGGTKGAAPLSYNRAKTVVDYLNSVVKVKAIFGGYGNTNFVASNATEAGRAANRRAEGWAIG